MSAAELNVVPPATLPVRTLADVRAVLNQMADPPRDTSLMLSAINSVARTLGCAPDDIAADPANLRLAIEKISAAMAGMTRSSWVLHKEPGLESLAHCQGPCDVRTACRTVVRRMGRPLPDDTR